MAIDRSNISEFRKLTLSPQWPTDREIEKFHLQPGTLIFRNLETGQIAGQVATDDLFDPEGNHFYLDA